MAVLGDTQRTQLKNLFSGLKAPVQLLMFTQELECEHCRLTRELLTEVAALSDKLSLTVYDFVKDADQVQKYGIDKIPAIALVGEKDYGLRFYGVPAGYEFTTLVEDIVMVSLGHHGLKPETLELIAKVDQPVHLQVIISLTCPLCPAAVRMAHRLALASERIRAEMVESMEFPHLVQKYKVNGVPHTVINETYSFVGPQPEEETAREILRALGKLPPKPSVPPESDNLQPPQHQPEHHHEHDHEAGSGEPSAPVGQPKKRRRK